MVRLTGKRCRKDQKSNYRNIIKFKKGNQYVYQVKFRYKNKDYGQEKKFTSENKAILFRNELWRKHHPELYEQQFPSEDNKLSSSEENSILDSSFSELKFQMPERVPDSAKRVIYTLQKNICPICRQELKCNEGCHLDHIYPKQFGGPHEMKNFQMLHYNCHQMKTDIIDKNSDLKKILTDKHVHVVDKIKSVKKVQSQIFD